MSTSAPYIYSPLLPGQIRLLRLLPGTKDDEVAIEIIHRAAKSKPKYEALSYVWGLPDQPHQVVVTQTHASSSRTAHLGERILAKFSRSRINATFMLVIGKNLFVALEHLRHKDKARVLWIDAICINQDDPAEKSTEVLRMGDIYRNARRVVVWLGEESEDSSLAMSKLREIGQDIDYWIDGMTFKLMAKLGSKLHYLEAHREQVETARTSWIAINRLFGRPWFTRLWVLQEIGLASNAVVVAGGEYVEWEIFRGAMLWIGTHAKGFLSGLFDERITARLEPFNFSITSRSLLDNGISTIHTHCFDPRDRIYAVLNLLKPEVASRIVPDYSRSVEQIYTDTVLAEIEGTQRLDVLALCIFPSQKLSSESRGHRLQPLPSWVPDFSNPTSFWTCDYLSFATGFSRAESCYKETKTGGLLKVRGRLIDSISSVSAPMPTDATLQDALEICQKWEPVDAHTTEYIAGGFLIEVFASAISSAYARAKFFHGSHPTTKALVADYRDWVTKGGLTNQDFSEFAREVHSFLMGRVLFTTQKGYLGVCSAAARTGDHVCILLGCCEPLILRPTSGTKDHYQLGGSCFVPGLQFNESLLGPLPLGWRCNFVWRGGYIAVEFYGPNDQKTELDPRGGPLPSGWEVNDCAEDRLMKFGNVETGESSYKDPRLSSENLKTLGIELEEITLV